MKTKQSLLKYACVMGLGLLLSMSCGKDEEPQLPDPGEEDGKLEQRSGISEDELEAYEGDLGLLISARDLEKKGYKPAKVNITTTATEGDYDQQIIVDPFTNLAPLLISIGDLTTIAEAELRLGVGVTIETLNDSDNVIATQSYTVISFEENGKKIEIDATALEFLTDDLNFKEGLHHYLQLVNSDGIYNDQIVNKPGSGSTANTVLTPKASTFNRGTWSEQFKIYKFPNEENTFAIWSALSLRYMATDSGDSTFRQSGVVSYPDGINDSSLHPRYKFIIKRETNGLFTINDMAGNPMKKSGVGWRTIGSGAIQYFRIIALDIEWETQELDTKHLQPIFPPVETSFGYNSTLVNCGAGGLSQEVGVDLSLETTSSTAFSESIGLSARVTVGVEATVSATAEASFFGNGGSVTGEVSASLEVSVEASKTTTRAVEETDRNTETLFSKRTVTVPSGSASLVYDAYQIYSNVRVPYIKRFRLKGIGTENTTTPLTGLEIATQLNVTSFSGTIGNIGADFVEVTIKGEMILDNMVETVTEVRDVEANCN